MDLKGFFQAASFFLLLTRSVSAVAGPWFGPCDAVLTTRPFQKLNDFYQTHADEQKPALCFRLNDREFLLAQDNLADRLHQGLYYYNATDGAYGLVDDHIRPGLSVALEFNGSNNKHFALLRTTEIHHGTWSDSFELLYLIPKKGARAFVLQHLFYVIQNPESGLCSSSITDGIAADVGAIELEGQGTAQATLVFNMVEQSCPDGEVRPAQRRFIWQHDQFVELPD